jgi:hypothetical protein
MGMQTAQSTQPISQQQPGGKGSQQYQSNPQGGKGMAQPTGSRPQGDYGDPNLIQSLPAQAQQYAPSVMPQGGEGFGLDQNAINANPQGFAEMQQGAQQQEQQHPGSTYLSSMGGPNGQATAPIGQTQGKGQGGIASTMQMPPPTQSAQQYQGKGGSTNAATSGQPRMGQANPYSNTIQPWDNGNNQTQSGKGKGH